MKKIFCMLLISFIMFSTVCISYQESAHAVAIVDDVTALAAVSALLVAAGFTCTSTSNYTAVSQIFATANANAYSALKSYCDVNTAVGVLGHIAWNESTRAIYNTITSWKNSLFPNSTGSYNSNPSSVLDSYTIYGSLATAQKLFTTQVLFSHVQNYAYQGFKYSLSGSTLYFYTCRDSSPNFVSSGTYSCDITPYFYIYDVNSTTFEVRLVYKADGSYLQPWNWFFQTGSTYSAPALVNYENVSAPSIPSDTGTLAIPTTDSLPISTGDGTTATKVGTAVGTMTIPWSWQDFSWGANIVNPLLEGLKALFIPDATFFQTNFDSIKIGLQNKLPTSTYNSLLSDFKNIGAHSLNDIYIDIYGQHLKVVDFSPIRDNVNSWADWIRGFLFFFLVFYNYNQIYKLVRSSSLADGTGAFGSIQTGGHSEQYNWQERGGVYEGTLKNGNRRWK